MSPKPYQVIKSQEILRSVYVAQSREALRSMCKQKKHPIKDASISVYLNTIF